MTILELQLLLIAIPVNIYPLVYLFRPWWTTAAGRALFVKAWGNLILIDLSLALTMFGDYPGRVIIRTIGLTLFMVGVWWLLAVLLLTPRDPKRREGRRE